MKRLIPAALFLAVYAFAQGPSTTKVVSVKYADPRDIASLVQMYNLRSSVNPDLRVVQLTGSTADIAAAEAAIARFDVPPKTIELVVHFVVGSDQPNLAGSPVPADVRDVISQLKSTFTFKDYRMLDTLSLRTRAGGSAETTGILTAGANPRLSQFSIRRAVVSDDGTIRIDRMHAGLRIPINRANPNAVLGKNPAEPANRIEYMNTGIDQDVDVKEGQKVVVGRASLEGPEKALFLILTAKVVQ